MREDLKKYLEYVVNTGGNATTRHFDNDWEPIGPMVRRELVPTYIDTDRDGKLFLTEAGKAELADE